MGLNRILGAAILIGGVVVLGFAFNAADAPFEQLSEQLSGKYAGNTATYFVLGAIAVVSGGLLIAFGTRAK